MLVQRCADCPHFAYGRLHLLPPASFTYQSPQKLTGPVHAQNHRIVIQEGENQADGQGEQEGCEYAACNSKGQTVYASNIVHNPVQHKPVNQQDGKAVPSYGGEHCWNRCKQGVSVLSEKEEQGAGKEHLGRCIVVNQRAKAFRGLMAAASTSPDPRPAVMNRR